ncbi:MAG: TetR/AcrR family transcriptional regulator [Clostridiales bacterium]|nr:TetR/AcrR family transcriptional regulator [Clostridiales bacterium]
MGQIKESEESEENGMPKIFDSDTREDIKSQMLDNGFSLIKRFGLKKTTIEDVTRASGVAKGTFYNFFKTKEEFIYQIVIYKRRVIKEHYLEMSNENGGIIDRHTLKKILYFTINGDFNLLTYLNRDDMAMLTARWPKEYMTNAENDEKIFTMLLDKALKKRKDCDWKVFTNIFKIVSQGLVEQDKLHQDALDMTIDQLIEGLLDYVFEKEPYQVYAANR